MAHEAAHVVLHRILFEIPLAQGFFSEIEEPANSLLRCLKRDVSFKRGNFDWKEVQANRGMAALLMPRCIFQELVLVSLGLSSNDDLLSQIPESGSLTFSHLLLYLSRKFEVSQEAARIRLESLELTHMSTERMLP